MERIQELKNDRHQLPAKVWQRETLPCWSYFLVEMSFAWPPYVYGNGGPQAVRSSRVNDETDSNETNHKRPFLDYWCYRYCCCRTCRVLFAVLPAACLQQLYHYLAHACISYCLLSPGYPATSFGWTTGTCWCCRPMLTMVLRVTLTFAIFSGVLGRGEQEGRTQMERKYKKIRNIWSRGQGRGERFYVTTASEPSKE